MSKVGRNEPCHCGSGKKYKNCHWEADQQKGLAQPDAGKKKQVTEFEVFALQYNTLQILGLIGALQLHPPNHGKNVRFEEMARLALLCRTVPDNKPLAYWGSIKSVIKGYTDLMYMEDQPTAAFTENAIFSEGNYIVYPGITTSGTQIINQLTESIFLMQNHLPQEFKKQVGDGIGLLLFISDSIAGGAGHKRYMYEADEEDNILFPGYETTMGYVDSVYFKKDFLEDVCAKLHYDFSILSEFILPVQCEELFETDRDKNIVSLKPLVETETEILVYLPTCIIGALIQFIYRTAKGFDCYAEVLDLLQSTQFEKSLHALLHMGWAATNIELPAFSQPIPAKESILQFDNQKLAYVCFVCSREAGIGEYMPADNQQKDIFTQRSEQVVNFLSGISQEQVYQVLTLFILAETANDGYFLWSKPIPGNQALAFSYSEINAIAYSDESRMLTLWKFAKAYSRVSQLMRIMSMGGTLDAYSIFMANGGSLLHSDKKNPVGGTMFIHVGSSNNFMRQVQTEQDEHAARLFYNGSPAFSAVRRYKTYAPIYIEKDSVLKGFRLVIETYKIPIWVTNYQDPEIRDTTWVKYVCEGIAFWLHRMKEFLEPLVAPLHFVQFEIEIIVDEKLLIEPSFIPVEVSADDITIAITIDAPKARLSLPFDFIYPVMLSDNTADKLLMRNVLRALSLYIEEATGRPLLTEDAISEIVENVLQPPSAKMFLFGDTTNNIRMDDRNLPPLRYLDASDVSYVLDNILSYLPKGYVVPTVINQKEDKIKLCNDIVSALIGVIEEKIKPFDGKKLLMWLIRSNEKCIQFREFREILIPAKIACFSNFDDEVLELTDKEELLVTTAHATRTLIEFVATNIPTGTKWPNYDDIDELLSLVNQVTAWGTSSDAIWKDLVNPEMGLLPSGRIGTEKVLETDSLGPFSFARATSNVFQYMEEFNQKYAPISKRGDKERPEEVDQLDMAFKAEFGIALTRLSKVIGVLINTGYTEGEACVIRESGELINILQQGMPDIVMEEIDIVFSLLTLKQRPHIGDRQEGYEWHEIFPWRYKRKLSYLMRPLIAVKGDGEQFFYYYGYRHMMAYFDNLYYLLETAKLPKPASKMMQKWLGDKSDDRGTPFRNAVKEWLKRETNLKVVEHEIDIKPKGPVIAPKDLGDIDILAVDLSKMRMYSIECKNITGARNIYEMWSELEEYLGDDCKGGEAKIIKHLNRHEWLDKNKGALNNFVQGAAGYTLTSLVITPDEVPLAYLKKQALPLPLISFVFLRKDGAAILDKL